MVQALAAAGCETGTVGVGRDLHGAVEEITDFAPDVVFNLCESIDGDKRFEPLLPLLLERDGLAYTGSSPLTLGLCAAQAQGQGDPARRAACRRPRRSS